MGVTITDYNDVDKYLKVMEELSKKKVQIGVFRGDAGDEIMIRASVNEFGISIKVTDKMRAYLHYNGLHLKKETKEIKIPERSYFREGFDKKLKEIEKIVQKQFLKVMDLRLTVDAFYALVGSQLVGVVQNYMTELKDPDNSSYTVKKKGSSNPLIDTGELRSKITYKVV